MSKVGDWLASQGLGKYEGVFAENSIEWALLADLTADDLKELGFNIGERRLFLKAVSAHGNPDEPPVAPVSEAEVSPGAVAERRQLTVMFCDLVGSTALSGQLDPEDLREVVRAYQKSAEAVIHRYGGHIAQYLGDGLLVYFGYPVAHEDDAQRAVYAGVGIPRAIDQLNVQLQADYSLRLSVRIGIHTGPVVVGEMGGNARQENLAMGETPNLAARLEALAEPGAVVISENTRRLLGELFALEALGEQSPKGIALPIKAFAVTGERLAETRFAAGQSGAAAPMLGRQQELALLLDRWRQAKAGEGQMVVLSGEAGLGKSRIMSALVSALEAQDHLRISYQCSPYHTDSALYPAIQQLTYAAGFVADESAASKLDKFEHLLRQSHSDITGSTQLLGALMGLGEVAEARHGTLELPPPERRAQTLQALLKQLIGAAAARPVLLVLEDAHWIDPTTLELIELALEQIGGHRIMLLITARPTFNHGFGGHPIVSRMALNRLGRESIMGIVDRITKGKALPPGLLDEIAAKTDGVPLFVEEFTKTLLESGQLRETEQGYTFDGRLDQPTIPSSLHDSLMARLDRMQPIKEVAQTAACIGREFGYALLAAVSPLPHAELTGALDQLVAAELIFKRGVPPASTYTFKHALVRDAAYESLLKGRRLMVHGALLTHLQSTGDAAVELLAYHAEQAGRMQVAAGYWEKAGDQALNRPALSEAANQFERAVQGLRSLPENADRRLRELDLRVKLSHVAMARHGHAHPITVAANKAAHGLLDCVGETPHRFPVLYGNYVFNLVAGEHSIALTDANAMCDEAERSGVRVQKLIAYRLRGTSQVVMGDFRAGESTLEHAFSHFDPLQDKRLAWQYGTDHADALQIYWALSLLIRGEAQMAWDQVAPVETTARDRGHVGAYCYALIHLGLLSQVGRTTDTDRLFQQLAETANQHGLKFLGAGGVMLSGVRLNEQQRYVESVEKLALGLQTYKAANASFLVPHAQAAYAASLSALGRFDETAEAERTAIGMIDRGSEQWFAAEVHRLIADADYWHWGAAEKAIQGLRRAIAVAKGQDARLWELRATVSLARILGDQGERSQALELLTPVVENFPVGGRELADMAQARAVLQELA